MLSIIPCRGSRKIFRNMLFSKLLQLPNPFLIIEKLAGPQNLEVMSSTTKYIVSSCERPWTSCKSKIPGPLKNLSSIQAPHLSKRTFSCLNGKTWTLSESSSTLKTYSTFWKTTEICYDERSVDRAPSRNIFVMKPFGFEIPSTLKLL